MATLTEIKKFLEPKKNGDRRCFKKSQKIWGHRF